MKHNEVQIYKNIGTIQMTKNEDGLNCYVYTHFYSGKSYEEDTVKGAREMLDFEEKQAQDIQQAIRVLSRHNYKVYKEIG